MTAGQLIVNPETIRGLPSKLNGAQLFVGCFVQESEKHRTHSRSGPEIRWENTLTCNMPRNQGDLNIELVNESPNNGGIVATGKTPLADVCSRGHESKWVPLYSSSGESFGELKLNLSFKGNDSVGSVTSSFSGMDLNKSQHGGMENSRQGSFASLGPANPIPQNYGVGNPPPFTPPAAVSYPGQSNSHMPGSDVSTGDLVDRNGVVSPEKMTPSEFEEAKAKGKLPSWAKYGGALAGVAALGLTAWGAHELKEHFDKKEEEEKKHNQSESKPFVIPSGYLQPEKQHNQPTPQHQNQQHQTQQHQTQHYPTPPQQHVNQESFSKNKDKRDEKDEKKKMKKHEKEEKKKTKHKKKHNSSGSDSDSSDSSDSSDDEKHHKKKDSDWK
ncbi:hypothetical protein EDC96DRAFT_495565 [Choanephora cucurbitarum]|nr:hypothetical protein EDC96DRAFT_495565 [Choanephora cucurbitarum]